jgi:hypothetical protein
MAIVRLDKVRAAYNGNLESVKMVAEQTNGVVVKLGGLVAGERELKNGVAVTDVTKDEVVLVAAPEVMYDARKYGLKDFVIPAGQAARAYHLAVGDIVTFTADLISGAPALGKYVVPANGAFKLAAAADLTGGTRLAFEVIEVTTLGADASAAFALQVIKI